MLQILIKFEFKMAIWLQKSVDQGVCTTLKLVLYHRNGCLTLEKSINGYYVFTHTYRFVI